MPNAKRPAGPATPMRIRKEDVNAREEIEETFATHPQKAVKEGHADSRQQPSPKPGGETRPSSGDPVDREGA
ncbi:hypothetical protein [Aquabacterium sp. J223]|uniref:hypothetical protein n=1 Tax=Aquabacterium sp. J223 TaxID=2898431 RepID=UPI0021ADC9D2|nr:hypothetical protein [Aquabacterium sp. J223]UUX94762.1 hypothetical protein LRS07_15955 [Aquabacterium sp. J223]